MSIVGQVTSQTRIYAVSIWDVASNLFERNAADVKNFLFKEHCAMTNADEVHEVHQNTVSKKTGKKARHKSHYLVPRKFPLLAIQNSDLSQFFYSCWREYEQRGSIINIHCSRDSHLLILEATYIVLFYCYQLLFPPAIVCYNQSRQQGFRY